MKEKLEKQLTFIALMTCILMLGSCTDVVSDVHSDPIEQVDDNPDEWDVTTRIIEIENCKYIVISKQGHDAFIVHAANCTNHSIDLPEEFVGLSTDSSKPDTLIGYKSSDGVSHIGFVN